MWDVLQVFWGGQLSLCFLTEMELSTTYIWCMVRKGNNWSDVLYEIHFLSENISQDLSHWFKCVDWKMIKLNVYINVCIFISSLDGHFCIWGVLLDMLKCCIKLLVAPEEAACKLIISLRWCHSVVFSCIVGNVGASLCKGRRMHGIKSWVHRYRSATLDQWTSQNLVRTLPPQKTYTSLLFHVFSISLQDL